jgi:hypothetical protein
MEGKLPPVSPYTYHIKENQMSNPDGFREDLAEEVHAKELGFTVIDRYNETENSFTKGNKFIWINEESWPRVKTWWRCADEIDGRYTNHRTYDTLREALDKEA